MNNTDIDSLVALSERKKDLWIGGFFALWFIVNFNTRFIIQFFISQQEDIPLHRSGMSALFPYFFIAIPGIWVIMRIFQRTLPVYAEIFLIACIFFLSFTLSGQEIHYINYYIRNSELRILCFQTLSTLINTSQFLILPIWYIVRFMKITPHEMNGRLFGIGFLISAICIVFSSLIFDILKAANLFPYIL